MIIYLLKVTLAMSFCLGLYHWLLRDRKTFVFNRFYLLSTLVLSFFAPLVNIPILEKASKRPLTDDELSAISESNFRVTPEVLGNPMVELVSISEVLYATVLLVSVCLLLRFIKNLGLQLYKSWSSDVVVIEGLRVIYSNTLSPYSFFNTLFVPIDVNREQLPREILRHEHSHYKHLHSIDLLLIELLLVLQWYNPFIYQYRRVLRDNHEYTADHDVTHQLDDTKTYIKTLLQYALPKNTNTQLTLSFNHSSTKKRINMINSNVKSSHPFLFVIILFITIIGLVACSDLHAKNGTLSDTPHSDVDDFEVDKFEIAGMDVENVMTVISEDGIELDTTELPKPLANVSSVVPPPPPPPPVPTVKRPTQKYLVELEDPKRFGVWIDGKRVSNNSLKDRTPSEFSYYHESVLASNAVNFGKHTYQVDLMTNDAFHKWVKESRLFNKSK